MRGIQESVTAGGLNSEWVQEKLEAANRRGGQQPAAAPTLPSTVAEARAAGYSEAQINKELHRRASAGSQEQVPEDLLTEWFHTSSTVFWSHAVRLCSVLCCHFHSGSAANA